MNSEKKNHKNCTPGEPNGHNELSSVGVGEGSGSLGWRIPFLLVTNALFKDLFLLFQTSITLNTDCNCPDWKGDPADPLYGHVGKLAAGQPTAGSFQCTLKGTFSCFVVIHHFG